MSYDVPAPSFGLSGPNPIETDAFLAMLAELPIAEWPAPASARTAHETALALLDAVLADRQLGVSAWYVRDQVETSAFVASRGRGERTCVPRAARKLAEAAALALLVRPLLPAADFATLYGPFARVGLTPPIPVRPSGARHDVVDLRTRR